MTFTVVRAGAFTTVQDLGRRGRQRDGVPVSGAMDDVALRIANWLVGNDGGDAALEATLRGPALAFDHDTLVAITGADMDARIGDRRIAPWRAAAVGAGETLTLDTARTGCRGYIAVAGGIDVPTVLGSRSTYARARLGGVEGRALVRGDVLSSGARGAPGARRGVDIRHLGLQRDSMRLIPGPGLRRLDRSSSRLLFETPFTLAPDSDRMGLRFTGVALTSASAVEPLSGGVAMGTVQLPPSGAPIILMADRQTTGGYPRLGEVATVDLPVLAQLRPGDAIRFAEISPEAAEALYLARERELSRIRMVLAMGA